MRSGTCGGIHAKETGWKLGMWLCIMPRLPKHLLQELNAGTADILDICKGELLVRFDDHFSGVEILQLFYFCIYVSLPE